MIDTRGWLIRASLALGLIVIPLNFSDFTVKVADFVKAESANGATLWVDREIGDFPLQSEWKLVRVKVRLHDGTESLQTYVVDFTQEVLFHAHYYKVEDDYSDLSLKYDAYKANGGDLSKLKYIKADRQSIRKAIEEDIIPLMIF